jgi:hypothetical protein
VELHLHSPVRLHGVVFLLKHGDNFIFTLYERSLRVSLYDKNFLSISHLPRASYMFSPSRPPTFNRPRFAIFVLTRKNFATCVRLLLCPLSKQKSL